MLLQLPDRQSSIAFHLKRWEEICADPRWQNCEDRIETNAYGQIVMSPPPKLLHCSRQANISYLLRQALGLKAFGACGVVTSDGVKELDAAWCSPERYAEARGQAAFVSAPEICVEVISDSNTKAELRNKRELYFEAGAVECWTCDQKGQMAFYQNNNPDTPHNESKLCPGFPNEISD